MISLIVIHAVTTITKIFTHCFLQVTVYSKNNDDEQHCWESAAGGSFVVTRDDSAPLTRGTRIVLLLKEDMQEVSLGYTEGRRRYSNLQTKKWGAMEKN